MTNSPLTSLFWNRKPANATQESSVDGYGQILEGLILESKKDLIEEIKLQSLVDEDEACTENGEGVAGEPAELK